MEGILGYMEKYDFENLLFCQDQAIGLKAVIAIPMPLSIWDSRDRIESL